MIALSACVGNDTTGNGKNTGDSFAGVGGSNAAAGSASAQAGSTGGNGSAGAESGAVSGAAGANAGSGGNGGGGANAGSGGNGGGGAGSADACETALFCEKFDDYLGVKSIADGQKFGPWRATLTSLASMGLDGSHKVSGSNALHVHIDQMQSGELGGRLFADGALPIFATKPTHIYGRMMMYIDPNGSSEHWNLFGVTGKAEPGSPVAGHDAIYYISALPRNSVNTYSFVYGLYAADGYRDCSSKSSTSMPSAWACISFEMDSVRHKLRLYKDGASDPILSIDDHGTACGQPTPVTSPWYGPSVTQLFVGAWTWHPMNGPLDLWVDDLVVDTKPVACPPR